MSLKLIVYTLISKTLDLASCVMHCLSNVFEKLCIKLNHISYVFLEKRDLMLFKKLLLREPRGSIYSSWNEWPGLNVEIIHEFLKNIGCKLVASYDYDDMINYDELYVCEEVNRIISISYKYKVAQHIWIEWRTLRG